MGRVEKAARRPPAASVGVRGSVPRPGLVPMATLMLAVELVTVLLNASCTVTCTAGAMDTPAMAFAGWTVRSGEGGVGEEGWNGGGAVPLKRDDAAVRG